jgi:hypothetical protein
MYLAVRSRCWREVKYPRHLSIPSQGTADVTCGGPQGGSRGGQPAAVAGIGSPAAVVQAARARVLTTAYHQHPERFVNKPPAPPALPDTSWINPPEKEAATQ